MMNEQTVYKTLVIGVGSTGSRIVNRLASAVAWELGSKDRAPWLEYLCLETDAGERSELEHVRYEDFYQLGISKSDFSLMVADPQRFDSIGLASWMDPATLQQLPDGSVQSGVGNIRMIGRLAFLHEPNFNAVKQRVTQRLDRLRRLTASDATERRGTLPSGDNPAIVFGDSGVQVYVVGTLCGGTSSGAASDIGFFVRSLLDKSESVTAMFTVPRADLTAATVSDAARFKKNAYMALVELNHYHLPDRSHEAPILFPDGTRSVVGEFPYDLTYILMAKRLGERGETQVNQAIADRLFLHVFSASTNTAGAAVNAVPFGTRMDTQRAKDFVDRDHRAHVFCTFGLSVVDYPVQRVVEACQARLLQEALGRTVTHRPDDATVQALVQDMRIGWDDLVADLFGVDDDGLDRQLKQEASSIAASARSNPSAALDRYERLRAAFRSDGSVGGSLLERGGVTEALRARRTQVVSRIRDRVVAVVGRALSDPDLGVQSALLALEEARKQLAAIRGQVELRSTEGDLARRAHMVARTARHPLLQLLGVAEAAAKQAERAFHDELAEAIKELRRSAASHALVGQARFQGDAGQRGIVNDLEHMVGVATQRAKNLRDRLMERRNEARTTFDRIDNATPANGSTLYEPYGADGGSVEEAYRTALLRHARQPGVALDDARLLAMREVLGELAVAAEAVVARPSAAGDESWLDRPFVRGSRSDVLQGDLATRIDARAVEPFRDAVDRNVLKRLQEPFRDDAAADRILKEAGDASSPFLEVQLSLARRGNRSPIAEHTVALIPGGDRLSETVKDRLPTYMGKPVKKVDESDVPHQIVMIQELYRFPLSGVPSIVGAPGGGSHLGEAECNDFPTFWTRTDVAWTGLADREVAAVREAEEVLAAALLTGVGAVRGGHLVLPWQEAFGRQPERKLTPVFRKAVREVAEETYDRVRAPLTGARRHLFDSVVVHLRSAYERDPSGLPSFERFVVKTFDDLVREPPSVPISDFPRGESLHRLGYRFIARKQEWLEELNRLHPLGPAMLTRLQKDKGELLSNGLPAPTQGLFCPAPGCGSLVGETMEDAAKNGWQCFAYPNEHNRENDFGMARGAWHGG